MRLKPTREQRCTVAGWMQQTTTDTITKLDAVIASNDQPIESKALALAHQDLYRKVLNLAKQEQRTWCH